MGNAATWEPDSSAHLLKVEGLSKHFTLRRGRLFDRKRTLQAVRRISFTVQPGEVVAIVGESGSGKSTLGRLVLRLIEPTGGRVLFEGTDVNRLRGSSLKSYRRQAQMIFQNPLASFNPRRTIGSSLRIPFLAHGVCSPAEADRRSAALLEAVGLHPPDRFLRSYPHQLSGGQCQRVAIARALTLGPKLIVADEPLAALDMSVRTQVLRVLADVRREHHFGMLFITHDLNIARRIADSVLVMYLGQVVEAGPTSRVLHRPSHPYSAALLAATPRIPSADGTRQQVRVRLRGEIPSPLAPPSGCSFRTRCPEARAGVCDVEEPPYHDVGGGGFAKCHFPLERSAGTEGRSSTAAERDPSPTT